jgi:hypothetical protein
MTEQTPYSHLCDASNAIDDELDACDKRHHPTRARHLEAVAAAIDQALHALQALEAYDRRPAYDWRD